jgi:cytochrome P450
MLRAERSPVLRAQDLDWNLLNPAFQRDPYQHYRWERDHGTVHVLSAGDHTYYRIIGYDEIVTVLTDTETFSSRTTNELGWLVFRDPPEHDKLRQAIAKAFTPRAIAVLDAPVAEIVTDLWNHVLKRDELRLNRIGIERSRWRGN